MDLTAFIEMPGPMELIIIVGIVGMLAVLLVVIVIVLAALRRSGSNPAANPNLVPCPDCGHYVSRRAPTCPHCGRPFVSEQDGESTT